MSITTLLICMQVMMATKLDVSSSNVPQLTEAAHTFTPVELTEEQLQEIFKQTSNFLVQDTLENKFFGDHDIEWPNEDVVDEANDYEDEYEHD